jgi:uncharacterized pyridoxamine 5'-phosphate oxidase family protein/ferredoxin-like protein FixX
MEKAFEIIGDVKDVVISTSVDGMPQGRIITVFHYDDGGLYFLTCKTKPFYREIIGNNHVSMTCINDEYVQVRVIGEAREIVGNELLMFIKNNPSFQGLFETKEKSGKFVLFYLSKGKGETFDISGREAEKVRERFAFGGYTVNEAGCSITDSCTSCGDCIIACPFNCISKGKPFVINKRYCVECGLCYKACTHGAIELPKGM